LQLNPTRQYGGTGLGLTISARLTEMMGGQLCVDGEVDRGSAFHFNVKFRPAPAGATAAISDPIEFRELPVLYERRWVRSIGMELPGELSRLAATRYITQPEPIIRRFSDSREEVGLGEVGTLG
jgi:Histidine kinase-, DNA gyrase B-, and HSP90-like ATPase